MINIKYVSYKYPVEVVPLFLQKQKNIHNYTLILTILTFNPIWNSISMVNMIFSDNPL